MEYLMTYGFAVLIIAVVLAALYNLGVFSSQGSGTSCIAATGYTCTGLALAKTSATKVNLSFTFGENTGQPIYNIGMACSATATPGGLPNPTTNSIATQNTIVYLTSGGAATHNGIAGGIVAVVNPLGLANDGKVTVTNLICYSASSDSKGAQGLALTANTAPIGTTFSGGIYMNYTTLQTTPTAAGGTNPIYTVKIASFSTKVS